MIARLSLFFAILLSSWSAAHAAVRIVVSVDWEGRDLDPANLAAMNDFRNAYPDVPLQHFLNAAYFAKTGADGKETAAKIRSVLRKGDEEALHIHPWRSLVTAAGVKFRTEPAFKGFLDIKKCDPDCGHDVNLASYSEPELRKLIRFSQKTLGRYGFERARSFRAGAWQAEERTFKALAAEGFKLDSSATHAAYLKDRWGKSLLYPVVAKIWPSIVPTSQPYAIDLGGKGRLLELPNNGCLADYMSPEALLKVFQANAALAAQDPSGDAVLSIGFHQETAAKFLPQFRQGFDQIRAYAAEQKIPIVFETGTTLMARSKGLAHAKL